jgi:hypothetical protein
MIPALYACSNIQSVPTVEMWVDTATIAPPVSQNIRVDSTIITVDETTVTTDAN